MPRFRFAPLARALARRVFGDARAERLQEMTKGKKSNDDIQHWTDVNKKLCEQDKKLKDLEGEVNQLQINVDKEAGLYKQNYEQHDQKIEGALDELRFSFIKAIVACLGLTAALGSLAVNATRMVLATGSNGSTVGSGELPMSSQGSDACSVKGDEKAGSHSPQNTSEGKESTEGDEKAGISPQ